MEIARVDRLLIGAGAACLCLLLLLAGPAGAEAFFEDVTDQAIVGQPYPPRGSTFGDIGNDGSLDFFWSASGATPMCRLDLFTQAGDGRFRARRKALPLPAGIVNWQTYTGGGPVFGDYDNDGDLDLYVPLGFFLAEAASANLLLRNDRGVFHDVAREAGLTDVLPTDNAIWLDYDRDGFLDLYTGNLDASGATPRPTNKLYRNRGDGTFEDATQVAGMDVLFKRLPGGTNGGMAGADFNGDAWPDLYVGVYEGANRLFLNDGKGAFQEAVDAGVGDRGQAFGLAVGDIDNDGDLDIFQANGGGGTQGRNPLFRNDGQGHFEDVLEAAGLAALTAAAVLEGAFGDVDNDSDLDLLTGRPPMLFLNRGDGTFADATDQLGPAVLPTSTGTLSLADYDLDGCLDAAIGGRLYRNLGNPNHWLEVELVGTRSNRSGIHARLTATSGGLPQTREVLGGRGYSQDELAVHFGLGPQTRVDRLEIRWPSGQVDVLADIAADQRVRVIEGQGRYHRVQPTRWEIAAPDTVLPGWQATVSAVVRPALFETDARISRVAADMSAFGGPADLALADQGDGTYRLSPASVGVEGKPGIREVAVLVEQSTAAGPRWTRVARPILVTPAEDLVIFADGPSRGWQDPVGGTGVTVDAQEQLVVAQGQRAIRVVSKATGYTTVDLRPAEPMLLAGYDSLRFMFHPGDATAKAGGFLQVRLVAYTYTGSGTAYDQYLGTYLISPTASDQKMVDLDARQWQQVSIPLSAVTFDLAPWKYSGPVDLLEVLRFRAIIKGTFYLDEVRLVAARPAAPPATAVLEEYAAARPSAFALSQNYPNPFNSGTVIRFSLPAAGDVELVLYNLAGQEVASLAQGRREAGTHALRWDGRDAKGQELASGVYLYRLRTGAQLEVRKLLLLR